MRVVYSPLHLGRETSVLAALGDNARSWLRGAAGRPDEPMPAAGFTAGGTRA
jgi:hypothetical protein